MIYSFPLKNLPLIRRTNAAATLSKLSPYIADSETLLLNSRRACAAATRLSYKLWSISKAILSRIFSLFNFAKFSTFWVNCSQAFFDRDRRRGFSDENRFTNMPGKKVSKSCPSLSAISFSGRPFRISVTCKIFTTSSSSGSSATLYTIYVTVFGNSFKIFIYYPRQLAYSYYKLSFIERQSTTVLCW